MAASKKPSPAPTKKATAPATKRPPAAKQLVTTAKPAAARKSTPARKTASTKSATPKKAAPSKATATKATTTKMNQTAAKKPAPKAATTSTTKTPATTTPAASATAAEKKAPAKKTVARPVRPPSPDTPALLSNYRPDRLEIPAPRGTSKDGITYTKDFDVKFLKAQRDELLDRRASELARATRLEDEATSLIEDGEMGDVQFDDEGGEGDTMVVQRDLDRVLSTQARQTIEDIDAALARIEVGTYGYSEVSGQPIPRERLEALPETTVLAAEKVSGIGLR